MDVAFIIPAARQDAFLNECLRCVSAAADPDDEIILVLNGNQWAHCRSPPLRTPQLTILQYADPLGYSRAINEGAARARSSMLCLCDQDTFVQPETILKLKQHAKNTKFQRIFAPILKSPKTNRVVDFGIGFGSYSHIHPWMDRTPNAVDSIQPANLQAACSALMILPTNLFFMVDGFAEEYRGYYQDIDFCLRVGDHVGRPQFVSEARAFHHGRSSGPESPVKQKDVMGFHISRHKDRICYNIQDIMFFNLQRFFNGGHKACGVFVFVDVSTVTWIEEYTDILKGFFNLKRTRTEPPFLRDRTDVSLFESCEANITRLNQSILYFADRISGIENNQYILCSRLGMNDVVVDRHCNVVRADQLVYKT